MSYNFKSPMNNPSEVQSKKEEICEDQTRPPDKVDKESSTIGRRFTMGEVRDLDSNCQVDHNSLSPIGFLVPTRHKWLKTYRIRRDWGTRVGRTDFYDYGEDVKVLKELKKNDVKKYNKVVSISRFHILIVNFSGQTYVRPRRGAQFRIGGNSFNMDNNSKNSMITLLFGTIISLGGVNFRYEPYTADSVEIIFKEKVREGPRWEERYKDIIPIDNEVNPFKVVEIPEIEKMEMGYKFDNRVDSTRKFLGKRKSRMKRCSSCSIPCLCLVDMDENGRMKKKRKLD